MALNTIKLQPFFSYFGSKYSSARYYPQPIYDTILEPFAGSAGYSLNYSNLEVRLYDVYPVVCALWDYLIKVHESEIRALPTAIDHVDCHSLIPEQKSLIAFWLNKASAYPKKSATRWVSECYGTGSFWDDIVKERIAGQLKYIRHWKIFQKSYKHVDNRAATWFVDPPYVNATYGYVFNYVDYNDLAYWCQQRQGQVIVCEQSGATWLPFQPLGKMPMVHGRNDQKTSSEVMWYDNKEI